MNSNNKKANKKQNRKTEEVKLTKKQLAFCRYYVECGNTTEAARKAGYSQNTAGIIGNQNLQKVYIQKEIERLMAPVRAQEEHHIATAQEVMQFFTDMMNGKIKDQFGLDASNNDRIKAAQEIAKRTVDIENRNNGVADAKVEIKLDWSRDDESGSIE